MQVLSEMLDKSAMEGKIGYHPQCQKLKLTHLCFADDLLVFTDGKKRSIEGILQIFETFAAFSGLKISLEKSTLYMAGVRDSEREQILSSFPFESGTLPVRYLGLPLLTKRMTTSDYSPLIERIRERIGSWTAKHLSFAGRLQLISSVIHSLTNFWMSAFRLSSACTKEIDSLCSAFLWSGPELSSKKLRSRGVSCLKLIWRLLSSNSLWVQWLRLYLMRKGSFWSIQDTSTLGSWMWKRILKYCNIASVFVKYAVGNGTSVSYWYDNWSPLEPMIEITGNRGCIDMGIGLQDTVANVL
ncbi:putative RNA-directed DNA polymerase [Arabidopsis thaliana]